MTFPLGLPYSLSCGGKCNVHSCLLKVEILPLTGPVLIRVSGYILFLQENREKEGRDS